jgi:di/tricarboxylate transporter
MDWQGWLTLVVLAATVVAMAREIASPDVALMGGLFALAAAGVLTPVETFAGFSNQSMATVGALLILSAALRDTGAVEAFFGRIFGRSRSEVAGLARMMAPVAAVSAFLNNTAIVAMMTPVVIDWSRRNRSSPARFLIPLSYAAILGGVVTLIGTSTNLTVNGLMIQNGMRPMSFFELAPAGLPVCAAGLAYMLLFAPRLLPDRRDPSDEAGEHRREYTVAMVVEPKSPLVGQAVEEGGLRHLPGLFLVEIDRAARVITPVAPDEVIREADRLVFVGVVETIVDLQKMRGLAPDSHGNDAPIGRPDRRLTEAVISPSSPLVGQSIRDANFRTVYDAAVIAVHRNGVRVGGKIGEVVLEPGDTLLMQTAPGFVRVHRNSPDFYLVSEVSDSEPPRFDRARIALGVLGLMVFVVWMEWLPISVASFLAAGALIATRCTSAARARAAVDWPLLVMIAASIGLASAIEKTGAAAAIAHAIVSSGSFGPTATLAVTYFATVALTEVVNHNAAAALMFPVGVAAAGDLGVDPRAFVIAITVAASCAFATPFGYTTHLIVYGPGGYRYSDFVRIGLPLDLLCGAVAIAVIPVVWRF